MKNVLHFIRILFKKSINDYDVVNLWLIPCHNVSLEKLTKDGEITESRVFYGRYQVSKFQYWLWEKITFFKVRRINAQWFFYIRHFKHIKFPVIERYLPDKEFIKKGFCWVLLNSAPIIRDRT